MAFDKKHGHARMHVIYQHLSQEEIPQQFLCEVLLHLARIVRLIVGI